MAASPHKRQRVSPQETPRRVTFDVSGTLIKISRETLGYLGNCDFIERMEDVGTDEAIELNYPLSIFDDFHCALIAARRDVGKAMAMVLTSLESPRSIVLQDLLDYLGYDWLLGKKFEAPLILRAEAKWGMGMDPGFSQKSGWDIGRVWTLLEGGILQHLQRSQQLILHESHGSLAPPEPGDVALLGEVRYSNRRKTYLYPILLRKQSVTRFDARLGSEVEYFIPHLIPPSGWSRLLVDVGPRHVVKLKRLVLAVSVTQFWETNDRSETDEVGTRLNQEKIDRFWKLPGHFSENEDKKLETYKVSGSISVVNGHEVVNPDEVLSIPFEAKVAHRQHTVVAKKRAIQKVTQREVVNDFFRGRVYADVENEHTIVVPRTRVKAANTCSLVQVVVPENLMSSFVGRIFSITLKAECFSFCCSVYTCELFGDLYEVPQNVDISNDRASYMFDSFSLERTALNRLREHEAEKLRIAGLVRSSEELSDEEDDDTGDEEEEEETQDGEAIEGEQAGDADT